MIWYAAHIIVLTRYLDGNQTDYPVWENIVLIQAEDSDTAWELAEKHGHEHYEDPTEDLTCDGRPARHEFVGVRKLMEIRNDDGDDTPAHGCEITYLQMEVASQQDLDALMNGRAVHPLFDDFADTEEKRFADTGRIDQPA